MRGIARPDAQKFSGRSQTASSRSRPSSILIYPLGSVRRKIMTTRPLACGLHNRMLGTQIYRLTEVGIRRLFSAGWWYVRDGLVAMEAQHLCS